MASRSESKRRARQQREAAELALQQSERRRQRLWLLGGVVAVAVVVAGALIAVSAGGGSDSDSAGDVRALLDGIPQQGNALGDPEAPVTMVEFVDPQCPFCAQFSTGAQPEIIERYVRSGDLRIELETLTFLGPDSETIARAAQAAADQDGLWQFMELAFQRQGPENSGYADPSFIESVAEDAGLDAQQIVSGSGSEAATDALAEADSRAQGAGVDSTPSFLLGPTEAELEPLEAGALDFESFSDAIDAELESGAAEDAER